MINYFWIEIKGKNPKRFLMELIKQKICIETVKYKQKSIYLKVSYTEYQKIKKLKTIYEINIIKTVGKQRAINIIKKYKTQILSLMLSIVLCVILSKLILVINIDTENKQIKQIIKDTLTENNITLYSKQKSYKELNKISKTIKQNNINKIEWVELSRKGTILNIKVIERVVNDNTKDNSYKDIVASKNGYIKKIYSRKGQLLKNIDDYVKKGDIIISGNIYRNEEVIEKVKAEGKVYAEVWYIIKLNESLTHQKLEKEEEGTKRLILKTNNKEITLFKIKKKVKTEKQKQLFKGATCNIIITEQQNQKQIKEKYNTNTLTNILLKKAEKALKKTLQQDEYIIKQKTLKKYTKNDKMYIEVFFKTYENIAQETELHQINSTEKEE